MTKEQYLTKTGELIENCSGKMEKIAIDLLHSGAIDLDYYEDDYKLPKQAMYAICKEMTFQFKPLTREGVQFANNLTLFT